MQQACGSCNVIIWIHAGYSVEPWEARRQAAGDAHGMLCGEMGNLHWERKNSMTFLNLPIITVMPVAPRRQAVDSMASARSSSGIEIEYQLRDVATVVSIRPQAIGCGRRAAIPSGIHGDGNCNDGTDSLVSIGCE